MKVLITGANGQLGRALQAVFPDAIAGDVDVVDITDIKTIRAAVDDSIQAIINAAAYTNVDGAEDPANAEMVQKVNVDGVANLAKVAEDNDIPLVHISTEYIFDGTKKGAYSEDNLPNPLGVYAKTKLASEHAAQAIPMHYIIRTSWVVGDGHNFVRTMLHLAEKGVSPTVVSDQIGRLTFTPDLAQAIQHLLEAKAEFGTYNITNSGQPASWADVAREVFKVAGVNNTVSDITTEEYFQDKPNAAPRPKNSVLSLDKAKSISIVLPDWHDSLREYVKKEIA